MKTTETGNEFWQEFDFRTLQQSKIGNKHKSYGDLIRLEPDVAKAFPTSTAVHEALRYLMERGCSLKL
jgi:hypothetical protein